MTATRILESTADVVTALGGTAVVARLTGRRMTAVSQWISRGRFPANTFVVISAELKRIRAKAPLPLWGMADLVIASPKDAA